MIQAVIWGAIWGAIGGVCLWALFAAAVGLLKWWEPISDERQLRRYRKENGLE